jgi:anti-sigma B factor antagonist
MPVAGERFLRAPGRYALIVRGGVSSLIYGVHIILQATTAMAEPTSQPFQIERHGDIAIITPSPEVEKMPENLMEQAAQMVLSPLRADPPTGLVFDLSKVDYVGSVFLSFLLRCHKRVKEHGSEVVVAGASAKARELLHMTALDTLWALYNTRKEAIAALASD